ncbi:MAG: hypothetical protein IBX55_15935 [Methyloprofundus sp.]|nr:hypothetical protein [Methyloprofundus sp.]
MAFKADWLKTANNLLGAFVERNDEQSSARGNDVDQSRAVDTGKAPDGSNLTQMSAVKSNPYILWGGIGGGVLVIVLILVLALKK